jgi:hypothetical protein
MPAGAQAMSEITDGRLAEFEAEIERQEELLYGIALFFEGVSLVFAGQHDVIETYRKQFRNVIQNGSAATQRARDLLAETRQDARKLPLIEQYAFNPGEGYTDPPALVERARILVATYQDLFPDRPRETSLTPDETLKLLDAASLKLP